MTRGAISRRLLIRRAGVLAVATGVLAACAPATPSVGNTTTAAPGATSKPASSGKLQLPTFVPPKVAAPDVPGSDTIPDGYSTYPKNPTQSVASPPGDGSEVTVAGET